MDATCPMPDTRRDDELRRLLGSPRTVAVVGLSPKPGRPSTEVALYLQQQGFEIVGIHPRATEIEGMPVFPDLPSIPEDVSVDIVDLFVAPARQGDIVEQASEVGAKVVWFQPGAENPQAEKRAAELGMKVYSGTCTKADHRRLFNN